MDPVHITPNSDNNILHTKLIAETCGNTEIKQGQWLQMVRQTQSMFKTDLCNYLGEEKATQLQPNCKNKNQVVNTDISFN